MKEQPAVDIEINFDLEFEEFGSSPEMADARHIKVTVEDEEIIEASLELLPPSDKEAGASGVCPVKLRGKPVYTKVNDNGVVTFRAELDLDALDKGWGSVEEAARQPRFFTVKVRTKRAGGSRMFTRKRRGRLKINLNSIRWQWLPLERAAPEPATEWAENEPIDVTIDGTADHGFKLKVERWVKQPDGEYVQRDADFTHYIAPDGKADFKILSMVPPPWELEKGRDGALFHQPDTEWRSQELKPDNPILGKLPLTTSIRVQAWPFDKIARRFPNTFEPKTLQRYAIREIPLNLVPALEIEIKFDPDGERTSGDQKLEKNEFIADNEDELKFSVYVRRKNTEPEKVIENAEIEVKLDPEDPEYELETKPSGTERGKIICTLRSAKPLLYVQKRAGTKLKIKAKARIEQPGGGKRELDPVEKEVKPRFLFMKLWTVPGAAPGTSEAGVFVCIDPNASRPRSGQLVELAVGGANADFASDSSGAGSSSTDPFGPTNNVMGTAAPVSAGPGLSNTGPAQVRTNSDGTASWVLRYSGIDWDNFSTAQFKILCRLRSKRGNTSGKTFMRIDLGQNVSAMLSDLVASQASLELTNPEKTSRWGELILPNSFRGPAYNLHHLVCGGPEHYTCGKLTERIFNWWELRRFGAQSDSFEPERLSCMNGVEIAKYTLAPAHVFAGFYFSGADAVGSITSATTSPRMVDPWWRQEWGDHVIITWAGEFRLATAAAIFYLSPVWLPVMAKATVLGVTLGISGAIRTVFGYFFGTVKDKVFSSLAGGAGGYAFHYMGGTMYYGLFALDEWMIAGRYRGYLGKPTPTGKASFYVPFYWLSLTAQQWKVKSKPVTFVSPVEEP